MLQSTQFISQTLDKFFHGDTNRLAVPAICPVPSAGSGAGRLITIYHSRPANGFLDYFVLFIFGRGNW